MAGERRQHARVRSVTLLIWISRGSSFANEGVDPPPGPAVRRHSRTLAHAMLPLAFTAGSNKAAGPHTKVQRYNCLATALAKASTGAA